MKYLLTAAVIMISSAAYAQAPECCLASDVAKAMIKNHLYPVWAGISEDKGFIFFKGEDGKWAIVIGKDDMACITASGNRSKSAEGI